jgi:ParB family transcriptional regulator, chromosome partitioning protein
MRSGKPGKPGKPDKPDESDQPVRSGEPRKRDESGKPGEPDKRRAAGRPAAANATPGRRAAGPPGAPQASPSRPAAKPAAGQARLGRGLAALIAERTADNAPPPAARSTDARAAAAGAPAASVAAESPARPGEGRLRELPLTDIAASSRQPRRAFAADELAELAASIRSLGVVQPIVVRPAPDAAEAPWELIAGERRLRAARLAGVETIPALVRPASEAASLEIALAENVAREDLNAIEEALAFAALADEFGLTHERIGELVGKSRVAVTNVLRLLDLPDEVRELIERGELSEGHGRALLGLGDHLERRRVARLVVARGLTVRQTETLVRAAQDAARTEPRPSARPQVRDAAFDDVVEELFGLLEVPVRIRSGKRGGSLELRFRDRDELDRLVALLRSLK